MSSSLLSALVVAVVALLASSVSAQVNITEGLCVTMTGISASVPFSLSYRIALAYQQTIGPTQTIYNPLLTGNRHLATPTATSDVTLTGVASNATSWSFLPGQQYLAPYYVYVVNSLVDPTSTACQNPVCATSRQYSAASSLPTVAGGSSPNAALTLQQTTVSLPNGATLTPFLSEGSDTLGASYAIVSSSTSYVSAAQYSSPNISVPLPACAAPPVPALSSQYVCLQLWDGASTYGAWSASVGAVFTWLQQSTYNPANPYANANNTGEGNELSASYAYAAQDITGQWTFNTYIAPGVANVSTLNITGYYYSPMPGANPSYPTSAVTQPFYYQNGAGTLLDTYGWQLQLDGPSYFPDATTSSTVRLGYFQDTAQWFAAYRADQQVAFGSSLSNAATVTTAGFSPYINRGIQRGCGTQGLWTPSRFIGADNPTVLLAPSTVRVGVYAAAQTYSAVRATTFTNPGQLAMQLIKVQQAVSISALGIVSTQIESTVRMALYALSSGTFPSTGQWTLLAETNAISSIPTNLRTYYPYTHEIPLNVSSPVQLSAGQLVAVVVWKYGHTILMPGLIQGSTPTTRSALLPAQFVDVGPTESTILNNGFSSFAGLLPTIAPSQLFAVGLDNTQMAAFAVGQTTDGSSYVDPYASVAMSPAYVPHSSSSSPPSTAAATSAPANTAVSPITVQTVQYISESNDGTWTGGNIAALVVALVIAALVLCLLFFIAFRLAFGGAKAYPAQDARGQYNVVPVTQPAGGMKAQPAVPLSPGGSARDPYAEVQPQQSVPLPPRPAAVQREEEVTVV